MFSESRKPVLVGRNLDVGTVASSKCRSDEHSIYIKQGIKDQNMDHSQYLAFSETPYSQGQGLSPDKMATSYGRNPSTTKSPAIHGTMCSLSEYTPTAVTWSDSQMSPGATAASRRRNLDNQYHESRIPERVQKIIESTGIFRNTEIAPTSIVSTSGATPSPPNQFASHRHGLQDAECRADCSDQVIQSHTTQQSIGIQALKPSSDAQRSKDKDQMHRQSHGFKGYEETVSEAFARKESHSRPSGNEDAFTMQSSHLIVENHDTNLGKHQKQHPSQPEETMAVKPLNAESVVKSRSIVLSREQLAKAVRVKRPAPCMTVETAHGELSLRFGKHIVSNKCPDPERVAGYGELMNPAQMEDALRPTSVIASKTTSNDESHSQTLANSENINPGDDAQKPYGVGNQRFPQSLSATILRPQSSHRLVGLLTEASTISFNRGSSPRLESAKFKKNVMRGLPIRGHSRGSFGNPPRPIHLPSEVEVAPLYLNQSQSPYIPRPPAFETGFGVDRSNYSHNVFNSEKIPCLANKENYEARVCSELPTGEGVRDVDRLAFYDTTSGHQAWQSIAWGEDMIEHHQEWEGLEPGDDFSSNGGYDDHSLAMALEFEARGPFYDQQMTEGISMPGFWRPNRQY